MTFAERGRAWSELQGELASFKKDDVPWREGRLPVYVFFLDDETEQVAADAYCMYMVENGLGTGRAFKSLARMERELIDNGLALFNAPPGADGSFASGGTESLFLAVHAARERGRERLKVSARPNAVIPHTAHASLDKHGHYLGVEMRRIPVKDDFRADVAAMAAAIDASTVMLVGSAPGYTHGVFDPMPELGALAKDHGLWLHVDACWGGFLTPFAAEAGWPAPAFDLGVEGVTSLSADLHKYGLTAKGASLFLVGDGADKRFHAFESSNWPRGVYATSTFLGTRPGGAVAAAWAVTNFLGRAGYRRSARITMQTRDALCAGIEAIDGLGVVRPQESSIVLYRSSDAALDINAVARAMGERGWFVGRATAPVAIHLALNPVHKDMVPGYLDDLRAVVDAVRASGVTASAEQRTY